MSNCIITFDHFNAVYYSGQPLKGKIQLTTDSPKTIRAVHITINGYAKVKWKKKSGKSTTTYSALDQYLNSRTYVVGSKGGDSFEFAPGTYDYAFNCDLPLSLPSSVSGIYGDIKYEVILTLDRPYRIDTDFKREFIVIKELNLNLFPSFYNPLQSTDEYENFCKICCFGAPGFVKTKLSIPFSGYVPGQKISFSLEVDNESENDLIECKVKLNQRITFEARQPLVKQKYDDLQLDSKYYRQVLRKSSKKFEDSVLIPYVPPSSKAEDSCIRVNYILNATIKTGVLHKNITLEVPIVVGTTPLMENATSSNQTSVGWSNNL